MLRALKGVYLSDYVDEFKIEISDYTNKTEFKLIIEGITIHATLKLHVVNLEQISSMVTKIPIVVQNWCPII